MKRAWIWSWGYKKAVSNGNGFPFRRFPADSNCCGRFCRPLPNHSVREPTFSRLGRGSQQIRTAVDGFADRYLTTRSGNHFRFALQRYNFFWKAQLFTRIFLLFGTVALFFFSCGAFQASQFTVCRATCTCGRVFRMTYVPIDTPSRQAESRRDNKISRIFMPHKSKRIRMCGTKIMQKRIRGWTAGDKFRLFTLYYGKEDWERRNKMLSPLFFRGLFVTFA